MRGTLLAGPQQTPRCESRGCQVPPGLRHLDEKREDSLDHTRCWKRFPIVVGLSHQRDLRPNSERASSQPGFALGNGILLNQQRGRSIYIHAVPTAAGASGKMELLYSHFGSTSRVGHPDTAGSHQSESCYCCCHRSLSRRPSFHGNKGRQRVAGVLAGCVRRSSGRLQRSCGAAVVSSRGMTVWRGGEGSRVFSEDPLCLDWLDGVLSLQLENIYF